MNELFLALFRFGGIPYHGWFLTANKKSAVFAAKAKVQRRNVDIPTENAVLVNVLQIGVDMTKQRADEYVQQLYTMRKNAGHPHPEDIDRENPERIWHQPVTARSFVSGFPTSFPSGFRL